MTDVKTAQTFFVSGGSGGIGGALVRELASRGYRPIIGYSQNVAAADALAQANNGHAIHADLADDQSIDRAIQEIATRGVLAGVILAAAPPLHLTSFGRIDPADLERQWRINVAGPLRLLQGLVRTCLQPQKSGIILGILSAAMGDGEKPAARGMGAYITAKYGLAGLLAVLAAEYPWLRVKSARPGYTRTRMLDAFDDRFLELQEQTSPILPPDEVARTLIKEMGL